MKPLRSGAATLVLVLCGCYGPQADKIQADKNAILKQMHAAWDLPHSALDAGPVAVEGDYAVADWTQGTIGGRTLLKREADLWQTLLCAGDGIRSAEGLAEAGVPVAVAETLADKLARAENQVPSRRLALMSTFGGIVRMSPQEGGHNPNR